MEITWPLLEGGRGTEGKEGETERDQACASAAKRWQCPGFFPLPLQSLTVLAIGQTSLEVTWKGAWKCSLLGPPLPLPALSPANVAEHGRAENGSEGTEAQGWHDDPGSN